MIIDLHTHTRFGSNCSYVYPAQLVARAKQVGLDAVCITEHDIPWEPEALAALSREQGILVLGGVEVSTDCGQFLVFGVREPLWQLASGERLRELVDRAGGVMIASHPFRGDLWLGQAPGLEEVCGRPVFGLADAVEVFNGVATGQEVDFGCRVLRRLNLKGVGGSDSHAAHTVGQCVTIFDHSIASEGDLVRELKAGRFRARHNSMNRTY